MNSYPVCDDSTQCECCCAATADIERLTRERDEARDYARETSTKRVEAEKDAADAEARIAELEGLLRHVLDAPLRHDAYGHAYLRLDARSIYDLPAQIRAALEGR
jgi:hypothetical protein